MLRFVFLLLASLVAIRALAADVMFLQPDAVLGQRVPDVNALARYLKAVDSKTQDALAQAGHKQPIAGSVVVALRPGRRSNVWLDLVPGLPPPLAAQVVTSARSVSPPDVAGGTVVVALRVGYFGAAIPTRGTPAPAEWLAEIKRAGRAMEIEEVVNRVWQDK